MEVIGAMRLLLSGIEVSEDIEGQVKRLKDTKRNATSIIFVRPLMGSKNKQVISLPPSQWTSFFSWKVECIQDVSGCILMRFALI